MLSLKEIRDITLNYLGLEETSQPLADITSDPVVYLNNLINNIYIRQVASEYGYLKELYGKRPVIIKANEIYIDLSNFSNINSIYLNQRLLFNLNEGNTDIFNKASTLKETYQLGSNLYTNDIIDPETLYIFQNKVLIGKGNYKNQIINPVDNSFIGSIVYDSDNQFYTITITGKTGAVDLRYKTTNKAYPSASIRYKNDIYKLASAPPEDVIITVKGTFRPDPLIGDTDITIFKMVEIDNLIALDTAYQIALRLHTDEKISMLDDLRDELRERITMYVGK